MTRLEELEMQAVRGVHGPRQTGVRKPNAISSGRGTVAASQPGPTLPVASTWDDLMYRIYVRQKIDAGLTDLKAGRVRSHASLRREFAHP